MKRRKIATVLNDWCGTNTFLFGNVIAFAVWILINCGIIPGVPEFDPYPFSFLTLVVSLEAIVLSIFVLIAQNRSARIDAHRDKTDLMIDVITEKETTKLLAMMAMLLEKHGIDTSADDELQEMLVPTKVDELVARRKKRIASSSR